MRYTTLTFEKNNKIFGGIQFNTDEFPSAEDIKEKASHSILRKFGEDSSIKEVRIFNRHPMDVELIVSIQDEMFGKEYISSVFMDEIGIY